MRCCGCHYERKVHRTAFAFQGEAGLTDGWKDNDATPRFIEPMNVFSFIQVVAAEQPELEEEKIDVVEGLNFYTCQLQVSNVHLNRPQL